MGITVPSVLLGVFELKFIVQEIPLKASPASQERSGLHTSGHYSVEQHLACGSSCSAMGPAPGSSRESPSSHVSCALHHLWHIGILPVPEPSDPPPSLACSRAPLASPTALPAPSEAFSLHFPCIACLFFYCIFHSSRVTDVLPLISLKAPLQTDRVPSSFVHRAWVWAWVHDGRKPQVTGMLP